MSLDWFDEFLQFSGKKPQNIWMLHIRFCEDSCVSPPIFFLPSPGVLASPWASDCVGLVSPGVADWWAHQKFIRLITTQHYISTRLTSPPVSVTLCCVADLFFFWFPWFYFVALDLSLRCQLLGSPFFVFFLIVSFIILKIQLVLPDLTKHLMWFQWTTELPALHVGHCSNFPQWPTSAWVVKTFFVD